ncbi:unnamed protein product [Cuscuta campestris]|uniref:EF-hand domain-containing protein n=1 Tax=Cuscuta campestris TaxID=132261 RepID=A0A484L4A6_9ASTE|nr:unnamed protein product [Cuscuta campestris]
MATAANQAQCDSKTATRIVNPSSSSFRLRSPSLNSVRLRRIFDMFDSNNDGIITVDELNQPLNRLGLDANLADLDSTIQSFVNSKSAAAGLTFDDFQALHRSLDAELFGGCGEEAVTKAQEEAEMREAFKVFDEDNDGAISAKELEAVLAKLGLIEKGGEIGRVEQMISSVDRNRDGVVDFSEFKEMMSCVMGRHR